MKKFLKYIVFGFSALLSFLVGVENTFAFSCTYKNDNGDEIYHLEKSSAIPALTRVRNDSGESVNEVVSSTVDITDIYSCPGKIYYSDSSDSWSLESGNSKQSYSYVPTDYYIWTFSCAKTKPTNQSSITSNQWTQSGNYISRSGLYMISDEFAFKLCNSKDCDGFDQNYVSYDDYEEIFYDTHDVSAFLNSYSLSDYALYFAGVDSSDCGGEEIKFKTYELLKESEQDFQNFESFVPVCGIFKPDGDLFPLIKNMYRILKIAVPILVAILTIVEFLKVLFSGEDKTMKDAFKATTTRFILLVVLIFLPIIVEFVIKMANISPNCLQEFIG